MHKGRHVAQARAGSCYSIKNSNVEIRSLKRFSKPECNFVLEGSEQAAAFFSNQTKVEFLELTIHITYIIACSDQKMSKIQTENEKDTDSIKMQTLETIAPCGL